MKKLLYIFIILTISQIFLAKNFVFTQEITSAKTSPVIEAVKKVSPCVVKIIVISKSKNIKLEVDEFFEKFFGESSPFKAPESIPRGNTGSGIIIADDGFILTNEHVISGADKIKVTLFDKREFDAEIIGADYVNDIAILKIKEKDLLAAVLGNSDTALVGEQVIAIGSPYQYENTVTVGVLSAKGRELDFLDTESEYENLLQTDAAINPGNSGGPLINLEGEVIGINTLIRPEAQGIGFAIPINTVKSIKEQLILKRKIIRPHLGIYVIKADEKTAEIVELPKIEGVVILNVKRESPAQKAGLKAKDVILEIDNVKIEDLKHLKKIIKSHKPKDIIEITIWRDRKTQKIKVTLEELQKASRF